MILSQLLKLEAVNFSDVMHDLRLNGPRRNWTQFHDASDSRWRSKNSRETSCAYFESHRRDGFTVAVTNGNWNI